MGDIVACCRQRQVKNIRCKRKRWVEISAVLWKGGGQRGTMWSCGHASRWRMRTNKAQETSCIRVKTYAKRIRRGRAEAESEISTL
jgi:hypothetical protein